MLKDYSCWTGVGDAYIVLLKMYGHFFQDGIVYNFSDAPRMHCFCDQPQHLPAIKELFSIFPFCFKFIQSTIPPQQTGFPEILTTFEKNTDKEHVRFNPFPDLNFADVKKYHLPDEYVSVSVRAGRKNQKRRIREFTIKNIIKHSSLPVVLLGVEDQKFFGNRAINLVNMTSFLEACQIIRYSKMHYGFAGASCFVALSHRVPTKVWIKGTLLRRAMEIRTAIEWKPYIIGVNEYE